MITLLLLLFLLTSLSNQQTVDQLVEGYIQVVGTYESDCITVSGANSGVVNQEFRNLKFKEDRATKCFWECIYKKLDLISVSNEVLGYKIKQLIGLSDKDASEEIYQKCIQIRGSDTCETATGIHRCLYTSVRAFLESQ
ncbi:hypothetical protein ILUMI_02293 [Ignelater luminosus]|uniref:Uncharacterized protein n=1 Tax=Ignelater luminosus TaxID=2038154 RepID=A0A8K0DCT3_IGNLU|nr:hypothetical protein ILUMI_02293 [Ignelater luminosus]